MGIPLRNHPHLHPLPHPFSLLIMQTMSASLRLPAVKVSSKVRRAGAPAKASCRAPVRVVASMETKKAAVVSAVTAFYVQAAPAFAVVDDRLNGDGVGLPLGINEPVLGWVLLGMFTFIWSQYYSTFDGDDQGDDSGLS